MAHISTFMMDNSSRTHLRSESMNDMRSDIRMTMVGLNNHIARTLSPSPVSAPQSIPEIKEKDKYVWRMQQQTEPRKFSLFPAKDKLSINSGRNSPDLNTLPAEKERSLLSSAMKSAKREPALRRRKISVPELQPMTTLQEVAMDSPTIPGRPPIHERSISAPNTWRHPHENSSIVRAPVLDERAEISPPKAKFQGEESRAASPALSSSPRRKPLSPKSLAPLVIPMSATLPPQRLAKKSSARALGDDDASPPDVPPKSARHLEGSPFPRFAPFTPPVPVPAPPLPATISMTPPSASFAKTPNSAPGGRGSPKPWVTNASASPSGRRDGSEQRRVGNYVVNHRRGESEASIMDRGRPTRRIDPTTNLPIAGVSRKRAMSAEEQEKEKAFINLPFGVRARDAAAAMTEVEVEALRKQAIGQAERFEVLSSKDVETLSRELRSLDERCDYLRRTHRTLRADRRNLHERICQALRAARVTRFSTESLLKQQEAFTELDNSIDDWVGKLEQAENRRTRVRQKLLEHVAGACVMKPERQQEREESRQQPTMPIAMVMGGPTGENTPPRSPTKASSPHPGHAHTNSLTRATPIGPPPPGPPPHVPQQRHPLRQNQRSPSPASSSPSPTHSQLAAIEQSVIREPEFHQPEPQPQQTELQQSEPQPEAGSLLSPPLPMSPAAPSRNGLEVTSMQSIQSTQSMQSSQSIRIYADSDVYALLADVEEEIKRMSEDEIRRMIEDYDDEDYSTTPRQLQDHDDENEVLPNTTFSRAEIQDVETYEANGERKSSMPSLPYPQLDSGESFNDMLDALTYSGMA